MDDWDLEVLVRQGAQREADRLTAARWALDALRRDEYLVLSVATTGLDGGAQVIEMAVTDLGGVPRYQGRACPPPGTPISAEATRVHGLDYSDLALAPGFAWAYEGLRAAVYEERLLVYNEPFVRRVFEQTKDRWNVRYPLGVRGIMDLMPRYAAWCGIWLDDYRQYRAQKLPLREEMPRRALSDCGALCLLVREMAGGLEEEGRLSV